MKKMLKHMSCMLLAAAMLLSLSACGGKSGSSPGQGSQEGEDEHYVMRISHSVTTQNPVHIAFLEMKKYIERETDGHVTVEIYPNGQLAGDRESVEMAKNGTIECGFATFGTISTFDPRMSLMDIPFMFSSYDEAWACLDSADVSGFLKDVLLEQGLVCVAFGESGFRHITNSVKPIESPADLQGLKIRTMEAPFHIANFQALGANPSPIGYTELYLALQQKMMDGQENPITNIFDIKLYEVQRYLTLDGHIYDAVPVVVNADWYNSLPAKYQLAVQLGGQLMQNYSRFICRYQEDALLDQLEHKEGMIVTRLTEEQTKAFADISQPAVIAELKKAIDPAIVDEFVGYVENAKADMNVGMVR